MPYDAPFCKIMMLLNSSFKTIKAKWKKNQIIEFTDEFNSIFISINVYEYTTSVKKFLGK